MQTPPVNATIAEMDLSDPLASFRDRFFLPDHTIYLDGNSLGPLPRSVPPRVRSVIEREWGESLIRGWTAHDWIGLPEVLGNRIAALIGAPRGTVTVADSTSVNLFKLLSTATNLRPERTVILTDEENFPTDIYIAQGLASTTSSKLEVKVVPSDQLEDSLSDDVAVLMLTEVDYRTGRLHDRKRLTALAHACGALTVWDLAHSVGAFPVDVAECGSDFAVGCGYKYLNGGPGAPAFVYVASRLLSQCQGMLTGWMGHAAPFDFEQQYRPAPGIERARVGTPAIIAFAALDAALDVFDDIDLAAVRRKAVKLSQLFIERAGSMCPELELVSPADPTKRGNHVAFRHHEGYAVMQALIARGIVGDFRAPDMLRFGFGPLYLRYLDVAEAVSVLSEILMTRSWDRPEHKQRLKVT